VKRSAASGRDSLLQSVKDLVTVRKTIREMQEREKVVKARVVDAVQEMGEPDDNGSLWLDLDAPVDGKSSVKYERRVSRGLDVNKAEGWLDGKGLLEECQTTITVLDEEKLLAAHYAGKISEKELDKLYTENESWALKVV
jgi:hypothetical protein